MIPLLVWTSVQLYSRKYWLWGKTGGYCQSSSLRMCANMDKNPQTITNFIDSIYQLTIYEEPRAEDTDFLIPCMFALINTPKPHIRGYPSTLRSQYIRILILHVVERFAENHSFTQKLVEKCYNGLFDSCQDRGEFPNSLVHKRKVRLGQLLGALCPWVRDFADE